jgi:acetyl esterase
MCRLYDQAYACTREAAKDPLISPCYATVEQVRLFPPTLVITAGQDSLAAEAEAFKDKLVAAGVSVTFRRFEDARHGFNLADGPEADESWQMIAEHLRRYLGRVAAAGRCGWGNSGPAGAGAVAGAASEAQPSDHRSLGSD